MISIYIKGSGALFINNAVHLKPSILGGGQENGMISGTEAMPAICAFAGAVSDIFVFALAPLRKLGYNIILFFVCQAFFHFIYVLFMTPFRASHRLQYILLCPAHFRRLISLSASIYYPMFASPVDSCLAFRIYNPAI